MFAADDYTQQRSSCRNEWGFASKGKIHILEMDRNATLQEGDTAEGESE